MLSFQLLAFATFTLGYNKKKNEMMKIELVINWLGSVHIISRTSEICINDIDTDC